MISTTTLFLPQADFYYYSAFKHNIHSKTHKTKTGETLNGKTETGFKLKNNEEPLRPTTRTQQIAQWINFKIKEMQVGW